MSPSNTRFSSKTTEMSGAQIMASALKRHEVEFVFGQSNPTSLFLALDKCGIKQIGYRTENAGTIMADAYARVSHKVPIIAAQNGPAATLLVAGLAEALKASIPIIAIVQDVRRKNTDKNAFQELDHVELFKGVSKWTRQINECSRIEDYVDMAFMAASSGRPGPVVLIVPIDVFSEVQNITLDVMRKSSLGTFPLDRSVSDPVNIIQAAELLAAADAPIIIAGGGVHISDASAPLACLQEMASIPVATTTMGKGSVNETHPLSLGVVGNFMGTRSRTKHLRSMVTEADVVLLIGNRTNQNGTDGWTLYPQNAKYIHIDIDSLEIGRNYEAEVRLAGDAKLILEAIIYELKNIDLSKRTTARPNIEQQILKGIEAWHVDLKTIDYNKSPVRPELMMRDLNEALPKSGIVVADASYSSIWVANFLTAKSVGQRFLIPRGLAGLGWGFPFALGAKLARPESTIVSIVGDGGFAHAWAELETARRMNLPVIVIVLNNQILGYQKHGEKVSVGEYTDACDFEAVDHAAIAIACGVNGIRVENADAFMPALQQALKSKITTVIDVITDEDAYPPVTNWEGSKALD